MTQPSSLWRPPTGEFNWLAQYSRYQKERSTTIQQADLFTATGAKLTIKPSVGGGKKKSAVPPHRRRT